MNRLRGTMVLINGTYINNDFGEEAKVLLCEHTVPVDSWSVRRREMDWPSSVTRAPL